MARQGDIRLTGTSYAVLGLIGNAGEATPYDLKQFLEASIANFWPVQHTTFYGEPARLAKAGYLDVEQEEGGRRRKVYRLTAAGRDVLAKWVADPEFTPPQLRDEQMLRIFLGADPQPLLEQRLEWHRTKLGELEGYLEGVRLVHGASGVANSLVAGTTYHRVLADSIQEELDRRAK